jgi:hypothetical protein
MNTNSSSGSVTSNRIYAQWAEEEITFEVDFKGGVLGFRPGETIDVEVEFTPYFEEYMSFHTIMDVPEGEYIHLLPFKIHFKGKVGPGGVAPGILLEGACPQDMIPYLSVHINALLLAN